MIKLFKGDCFDVMKYIPNDSIDMVLTDPPYVLESTGGGMMAKGKGREFMEQVNSANISQGFDVSMFLDICKSKFSDRELFCGIFFCSGKQIIDYLSWAIKNKYQHNIGVWHKTNPPPLCNFKYLNDVEYWMYIKGKRSKILGSYKSKSMVYTSQINKKDKKLYSHPTIKPIELIEKFIVNHTKEGDVICDPFMGTGTTGMGCKRLKRNFIGIELDDIYFTTSIKRIKGEI